MRSVRWLRLGWMVVPVTGAVFWLLVATASARVTSASAQLIDLQGRPIGGVTLTQLPGIDTRVRFTVRHLPTGFHAFHVHVNGSCDPKTGFASIGRHYDQYGRVQPFDGDMPPILVAGDGTGSGTFVTDRFEVGDVIGMSMIVHELPDNFDNIPLGQRPADYTPNGPEALARSRTNGNAGPAIACGVIREGG